MMTAGNAAAAAPVVAELGEQAEGIIGGSDTDDLVVGPVPLAQFLLDDASGGGHAEHHGQAVLERPGYQFREELPAGEDPLACGRERRQHAAGRQQVLDRVHAKHRREQRRHRRQGADLVSDAMRHAQPLQAPRQRPVKAARQTDDHE
jgi:hypothetical protein